MQALQMGYPTAISTCARWGNEKHFDELSCGIRPLMPAIPNIICDCCFYFVVPSAEHSAVRCP
jgi:hypothetical protein